MTSLRLLTPIAALVLSAVFVGCADEQPTLQNSVVSVVQASDVSVEQLQNNRRWYSSQQVAQGRDLFAQYCAACHGDKAQETVDWKTPTAAGFYPPPPLNGTAHAWHHPLAVLDQVIRDGGAPVGGVMPAWGAILNESQRFSVIASFQDYWSDEIYQRWLQRELNSRQ